MKYIPLKSVGAWQTKGLLLMVMNQNPRGMLLDEMRKRTNIMNQIDDAKVDLVLKEDDYKLVCDALKSFPYGVAHKDLLEVIDAVLEAGEPPVVMLPSAANGKDHGAENGASA